MEIFQNGYALIIGVGNDLPATINDAIYLYDILVDEKKAGYPKQNVTILKEKDATKANILLALDNLIKTTKSDSTVIVYYSGHGAKFNDDYAFIPNDYTDTNSALYKSAFLEKINEIKAQKIMLIFDACHANGLTKSTFSIPKGERGNIDFEDIKSGLDVGKGVVFIASCQADELSYIETNNDKSLFTHSLVEALEGVNTGKNKEFVSYEDLSQYLIEQVPQKLNF